MPAERPSRAAKPLAQTIGRAEPQSRQKAAAAKDRAQATNVQPDVPRAADGHPLAKISMAASELIPTGQFANISIGPAVVEWWIDPREEEPISAPELANAARALNQLAELVEVDVVAVQRSLVFENMQAHVETKD